MLRVCLHEFVGVQMFFNSECWSWSCFMICKDMVNTDYDVFVELLTDFAPAS